MTALILQVGRDFLPRGPEICTRRPLVLQLVKVPSAPGGNSSSGGAAGAAASAAAGGGAADAGGAAAAAAASGGAAGRQPPEWGVFLHAPGKIFTDFDRIRWGGC